MTVRLALTRLAAELLSHFSGFATYGPAGALAGIGVPVQWHMSRGLGHGIDPTGLALGGRFLADAIAGRAPRTGPVTVQTTFR